MADKFRVALTRDILDSRGEPAFGRDALEILDRADDIAWEYLPAVVPGQPLLVAMNIRICSRSPNV